MSKQDTFLERISTIGSEDFPNEPVPTGRRMSWIYLTVVWLGAAMFVGLYFAGVELGTSMGTIKNSMIAIFGGGLFLVVFLILHGIVGQRTGCSSALVGIYAFGRSGMAIPGFHITDIGWYVVMTAQFILIINYILPAIDIRVYAALFSILFLTNGFIGLRQMARLNLIAMPILI